MSIDFLATKNKHPRDDNISFEEGPHIYTINGNSNFMSVTTWNHKHFQHFDADLIIKRMMNSWKWKDSKYYGQTPEEIKAGWELNRDQAASAGTKMHYDIECFYNNMSIDNDSVEWQYFQEFLKDHTDLIPFRTEWMIYDEELKFAGSIDMIFQNPDGTLTIYDWKRCKEIKKENRWQSGITECVMHLPDCNFWHYSLQLNTYKALLEKNYNVKVNGMYLVCMHPNNANKSYLKYKVSDMTNEITDLFELRKKMLEGSQKNA